MKKIIYALMCVLFVNQISAQSVITIGAGNVTSTSGNYNPIYRSSNSSSFDWSRAFYLFDAAELAAAGLPVGATITQVEWDKATTFSTVPTSSNILFNIFMKNSAMTSYAASQTWGTLNTGATQVYGATNQVIPAGTGFVPFALSTSFVYSGGALEVSTDWDISAVTGNPSTGAFSWNSTASTNHVGGTSAGSALTNASSMTTQTNRPNIRITFTPPPACSGTPNSGVANISLASGCPNTPFNLTATGLSAASALTYQWYSSPSASGPWSAISNATNTSYSTNTTVTTFYQMVTTCTVSALSATTSVTSFTPVGPCYTMANTTVTTCSGSIFDSGGQAGSYSNSENYTLTLVPSTANAMASYTFISFNTESGWDYLYIYDGNSTSAPLVGQYSGTGLPPAYTATNSTGILTLRFTSDGSNVAPGFEANVSCFVPPTCSGTPNSGVAAISSASGCPNASFNLNTTGFSTGLGISYQWYSSPSASGPWSSISTATNTSYATSTSVTTYYQMVTTCSVSALTATSSVVSYSVVNPGPCVCAGYANAGATSTADEDILNVSFDALNNTSNCTTIAPGIGSIQNRYSNYVGFLAAPTVTQGQTVTFTIQIGTCGGNFNNMTAIYIDYNQNGSFLDAGEQAYISAAATSGPHFETGSVTIPMTAAVGTTRMRVVNVETSSAASVNAATYTWGETEDYCVDIALSTLCTGTPASGTTAISSATGCPSTNYTVTGTGLSTASGITFQWYSSPSASGPWSAISNATNTSYSSNTTTTTYYQIVTTCSASALTATSSISSFSVVNPGPCVCATYPNAGATSTADEDILNVTFDALNNNSTCTTLGPGPGSIQNRYSNYTGFLAAPTVTQGQTVTFTMQIGTCGGNFNNMTAIYIDYNQNGSFLDAGEQAYISAAATNGPHFETGSVTIPMSATPGTTRMRFVNVETSSAAAVNPATYTWGETEDYCVDIAVAPLCSGAPASGTAAINTPTGCPSVTFNINVTGQSVGLGIQYQWYSSPSASGPWSAIPNATNTSYASSTTTTTYYQMETTCTVSAMTATSSVVSYSIVNPGPCVCAGYPGSSANFTGDEEILGVAFGTLNNNSTCTTLGPGPGSILNRYSNYSGFVSAPTTFQGQSVSFTVNVGTCGGNYDSGISIFIDYNQNGVFTDAGEQVFLSAAATNGPYITTGNITIPLTASVGTTRMRVVNMETTTMSSILSSGTYGYGETEDYCIDIQVPPACTGAPNSGTAAISTATGCISDPFTIAASGTSFGTGISYQWYSAPSASGPWSSVSNATATTYSSTSSSVIFFQMVTTCSNSAMSATTSIVSYTPFNCYTMSNATITSCTGSLYDSGGPTNMYQNNEDYTLTIVPSAANSSVMISFVTFSLENTYDYLYIYDGPTTSDPLIGSYTGNTLPPNAMATNTAGILTLQMTSDFIITQAGFQAALSCSNSCMGPPSAPAASGSVICSGNSTTLTTVATGTAMWYSSPSPSSPIATGSVFVTPILTSNTTYYVSDSTICGNSSLTPVTISVTPLPSVSSVASSSICSGNTATMSAVVTATAQWFATSTPTAPLSTNTLYTTPILNNTTTYYVRDTSMCGSSSLTPVTVTVVPSPTMNLSTSSGTAICAGQSATLTATSMNSYTWSSTSSTLSSIVVTPSANTVYTVTGYQALCNSFQTKTISVNVNPLPVVTVSASGVTTICATNGSIGLQGSPSGGVFSGAAVSGTLLSIANAGTFTPMYSYTSSVTGCSKTATIQVIVINCGSPQGLASQVVVTPQLRVYPNPNFGIFTVETGNYLKKTIELVDIAGRIVKTVISTDDTIQVNISELSNGLYQMSIHSENGVDVIKVVKE